MKPTIVSVFGTRPEIVKLSPLLPLFDKHFRHIVVHTGQHYDHQMDKVFFSELQLRAPDYELAVGSQPAAQQVGEMLIALQPILDGEKPRMVMVQGDTNSSLAGAMAAAKLNIEVGHIEAGCRSNNWQAPEEKNRILIDHMSDLLFAPDKAASRNAIGEGIKKKKITIVGNTGLDAALRTRFLVSSEPLKKYGVSDREFVLASIHRAENTDNKSTFSGLVQALNKIAELRPVVFPIHPRTKKLLEKYNLKLSKKVQAVDPIGHIEFCSLLKSCIFVASDSGGVQEEAAVMNVPCLVLRNETEWMRLVDAKKNFLIGTHPEKIVRFARELIESPKLLKKIATRKAPLEFGASEKIVRVLKRHFQRNG